MKKTIALLLVLVLALTLFAACGSEQAEKPTEENTPSDSVEDTTAPEPTDDTAAQEPDNTEPEPVDETTVRVGSLKGPTTMGLVNLMKDAENGNVTGSYEFQMVTQADELAAGIVGGSFDIALVPANLAAVLYQKTSGGISVIDINTLGVLYCVTGAEGIASVRDLAGKTVVTTGQGTTPEYALRYLLDRNGVECTLEFRSEATEVAALLKEDPSVIAVLPQPFVTVAMAQNDALSIAFSLTDEWDAVSDGSRMLTGVTIVRNEFLAEHPAAVAQFVAAHEASVARAIDDVAGTAALVAEYGIIEKAPIAEKALPFCNLVCITGEDMKEALSGYLAVLFGQDAKSVGGALPEDGFYWLGK